MTQALALRREAEGKAVGGACRHAGRAIEDCCLLNKRIDKAAIFAGWREMNDYMRDIKIEPVAPQGVLADVQTAAPAPAPAPAHEAATAKKGGDERSDKPAAKPGKHDS